MLSRNLVCCVRAQMKSRPEGFKNMASHRSARRGDPCETYIHSTDTSTWNWGDLTIEISMRCVNSKIRVCSLAIVREPHAHTKIKINNR